MKKPSENPLFLSPIRPLLAALFLTSPVAYALKENFLSFEGVFPLSSFSLLVISCYSSPNSSSCTRGPSGFPVGVFK